MTFFFSTLSDGQAERTVEIQRGFHIFDDEADEIQL
jgi:hypothetical protein